MIITTLPVDEPRRLEAIRQYAALNSAAPENAFDDLTALAAQSCETPIALISIVDVDREWCKSAYGYVAGDVSRNDSIGAHAIRQSDLFIIPDIRKDDRFLGNPLVSQEPHVGFYAGHPLITPAGFAIGTLCVMDQTPRQLSPAQQESLRGLSRQVMAQLELRRQNEVLGENVRFLEIATENARVGLVIINRDRRYIFANHAYAEVLGLPAGTLCGKRVPEIMAGLYEEQIRPNLDRAFSGERISYELRKSISNQQRYYAVKYEPAEVNRESVVVVVITEITEQKKSEALSKQSEAELRVILDAVPAIVFYKDRDGRFQRVNRELAHLMGMSAEAFIGKTDAELGSPYAEQYRQEDLRVISHGESLRQFEERIDSRDGTRWLRTDKVPHRDETGQITGLIGFAIDITERKKAETAFHEALRFAQSTIDALSAHICVLDGTGVILATNEAWRRFIKTNPPLAQNANSGDNYLAVCDCAMGPESSDAARFAEGCRAVIRGENAEFAMEYSCHSPGEQRWFFGRVTPFPGEGLVRVVVAHENITKRKQAEINSNRLAAIVESSNDAIISKNLNSIITSWNKGAERVFGYTAEEMVGASIMSLIPPDRHYEETHILARIRRGESVEHFDTIRLTKDGRLIDVSVTASPIKDTVGTVIGVSKVARDITERKRAESVLKESNRRFQEMLKNVELIAMTLDKHGTVTFCNDFLLRLTGWTREEVLGCNWFEYFIPDSAMGVKKLFFDTIELGKIPLNYKNLIKTRSGEVRTIAWNNTMLRNDDGSILGTASIGEDITAREQALESLQASEGRYRTLFEYAPDGILIADCDSNYIDANESVCTMLGYSRKELIGLHASDIVSEKEISHIEQALSVIKSKSDYHREWQFKRKNGSIFAAEVIATMMPDGNLLGMIRDITERKRIEGRFRRLVDSNAQGVMFWNVKGEISGANDAFLATVGYTREDLEAGMIDWRAITPPEYSEVDRRGLADLLEKGVCGPVEKQYVRKDGSKVSVLVGATTFEDNPAEGVSFVIDLTDRKKLEAQFLRAQRMESIGTLAGGIAHDLNNVLAPIMMSVEMLKDVAKDPKDLHLLDMLQGNTQRAAELVKQVLSFARGVKGERIVVNPLPLVRDLLKVMGDTFPKSIAIRFTAGRDLWTVTGDPTQIHQVFLNLCVNARDAMPSGGQLTLSMENVVLDETYAAMNIDSQPGPYVMVKVEDTGSGIPPEIRERIFEPFFTTKEIGKGTGLGLSTTLAIVKSHGGFINLYSEMGKGTKFKVYFPANTTNAVAESVAVEKTQLPKGNGELVLVVDDETVIREIAQRTLERFGYRVLLAANGAEAVALYALHRSEIAVVLTDMAMPVMDGPATIIALKSMNQDVKIIGSSGLASNGGVAKAVGAGVQHFIAKPYSAEAMLKTLHDILTG